MPYNITIDHTTTDRGEQSSRSSSFEDDCISSGDTGVHLSHSHSPRSPRSGLDSHELNEEGSWVVYDELGPSDSASRPHTSNRERPIVEAPQPEEATRNTRHRRRLTTPRGRNSHPLPRRSPPPTDSESVDSHDEWQAYGRNPPPAFNRHYAHFAPGFSPSQYASYPQQSLVPLGQQQMIPYGIGPYHPGSSIPASNYVAQQHHHSGGPAMIAPPNGAPFGNPSGYYSYPQPGYSMPQQIHPHPAFSAYPMMYSPPPGNTPPAPSEASPRTNDDEKFARLEKLLIEQRQEQVAKEAAAQKAAQEKAAKEEEEAKRAADIKAASDAAAAAAKEEAEKEHKAAEEKKAAEAAEAAAAAAAAAPPKEKDKPIKFKDAVGRKFSFPFHLCATWSGMEFLIKEAFVHIEGLGPHVAEGHYDLLGPHGEIILPHVWETVIEPDWTITMHMWPMTEEKEEDPAAEDVVAEIVKVDEEEKKKKKAPPTGFMLWTAGKKGKKNNKGKKK